MLGGAGFCPAMICSVIALRSSFHITAAASIGTLSITEFIRSLRGKEHSMSSEEDSDASEDSTSSSSSISSVDSDDPHWTLRIVVDNGLHSQEDKSAAATKGAKGEGPAADGPHLMLVPQPCTVATMRLLLRRKLGVEPKDTVLRLGDAPPRRIDSAEGMTLESLGFKDWCTVTVQSHPPDTVDVGLVNEMDAPKVRCGCSHSMMRGVQVQELVKCGWLASVDAWGCRDLNTEALDQLTVCRNLVHLDLTDTGVIGLGALNGLSLHTLRLGQCQSLMDQSFADIASIQTLRRLDISWCHSITNVTLKHIAGCANLTDLNVAGCKQLFKLQTKRNGDLGDAGMEYLCEMKTLERLNASRCRHVSDCGIEAFTAKQMNLQSLWLACCSLLTDESLQLLDRLPQLSLLDLSWLPEITDEGVSVSRGVY